MNCFLYQLQFNTPVHFGSPDSALSLYSSEDHVRADTLFSALCHTAAQLYGSEGVRRLTELASSGKLVLSDAMPWQGETLYLPKPYCTARTNKEQPADKRKVMKKLAWIPVTRFAEYCHAMRTGALFSCTIPSFGQSTEATKTRIPELGDAVPFPVGLYQFRADCGLYFLLNCDSQEDQHWLSELIHALGFSGIGGKVTAGYGKFTVICEQMLSDSADAQHQWLNGALTTAGAQSMLLTTSLPRDDELDAALDHASYQLVRRAGFIASDGNDAPRKKQTQHFLASGSILQNRFSGDVYCVAVGKHPVYRYSKPLFMGVTL